MSKHEVHVNFVGRIVCVGFGSIGQGVLPLILRHIGTSANRITILSADDPGRPEAEHFGVKFVKVALTRDNYRSTLEPLLSAGDFLLNLSVDVSSIALIELARERGALYLDTCIEPWAGGYNRSERHSRVAQQLRHAHGRIGAAHQGQAGANRRTDPWGESRAGVAPGQGKPCSTSPRTPASTPARRRFARTGPGSPRSSGSRSSTLRSGTPRWRTRRRSLTSSSILGRWTASSAKARNRPNWDGARTRSIFPRTAGATASGLAAPSI